MGGNEKIDHKAAPKLYFEGYSVDSIRELRNFPGKEVENGLVGEYLDLFFSKVNRYADLKQYDRNGNGKLDSKEFDHAMENATSVEELLRFDALRNYDKNQDGLIVGKESEERIAAMKKSQQLQLQKYDANNDGKIDRGERKVQTADLLDKQKVPLSPKQFKEMVSESVDDLKANLERDIFSDIMRDMHRAQETLPRVQLEKYMKAVNDEFHKVNPNADILEVSYFGKRYSLRIQSRTDPNIIYFFGPDQADMAKDM